MLHLFPLTLSELLDAQALISALDRERIEPSRRWFQAPIDVLAQQLAAMTAGGPVKIATLLPMIRRAEPFRNLSPDRFMAVVEMLHDGYVPGRETGRGPLRKGAGDALYPAEDTPRRSRMNVGTIPDWFDYEVIDAGSGQLLGRLDEEFAFESSPGQVFQLGGRLFRIERIRAGRVEVSQAEAQEAALPFWFGEGPGRSSIVSVQVCRLLARADRGGSTEIDRQLADFLDQSRVSLGRLPGPHRVVLERFPDPGGDEHIVVHAPYGLRLNRAWGLALRKRFCRQFNFELQAVATDNAVLISLGATHSFPLADVVAYLHSETLGHVLIQAVLDTPQFATRLRWCATTALAIDRRDGRGRVPAQIQRNQAENLIARIFPDQLACLENLSGPREVPEHPLVDQALHECLCEHMDLPGLIRLYRRIESGRTEVWTVETAEPSPLAMAAIHAPRHGFLDPAAAEERRTRTFEDRQRSAVGTSQGRGLGVCDLSRAETLEEALQRYAYLPVSEAEHAGAAAAFRRLARQRCVFALSGIGSATVWVHADHLGAWIALHPQVDIRPHLPRGMRPVAAEAGEALGRIVLGAIRRRPAVQEDQLARETGQPAARIRSALAGLQNQGLIRQTNQGSTVSWKERSVLTRSAQAGIAQTT